MKVIPAIDLYEGKVVRMIQGKAENIIYYSSDPVETAAKFREMGADRIHVIDLEGALEGKSVHRDLILKIKERVNCEIQTGGGLREVSDAEALLEGGVDYVIIASLAFRDRESFEKLVCKYPERIILSLDVKSGRVATGGWKRQEEKTPQEVVKEFSHLSLAGILHTDTERDGTLAGVRIHQLKAFLDASPFPVIVAGGIGSDDDITALRELRHPRLLGAVVGRAFYEGKVNLERFLKGEG